MKSELEQIIDLIKEVGVYRLGKWDGCACSSFSLRGVVVGIDCGKGGAGRGVWVSSASMDYVENDVRFEPIGEEVARQVEALDHRGPLPVFRHEWRPAK